VGPALEDVAVRGPLDPEHALELLGRDADAPDAVVARSATPAQYRAPERQLGRDAGERSDVYSLAALLYHHLTGSVPFPQGRGRAALFWHLHAPRPRPSALRPQLPRALDEVIARGMAPDPVARHPTVEAFLEDAQRAAHTRALPRDDAAPRRQRRGLALAAALVLMAAAGAAGFAVGGELDDDRPETAAATAGPLRLAVPADWRRSAPAASPARLRLADPLVLASDGGRVVTGMATPRASVALLERLRAVPGAGELVALGAIPARRYRAEDALGVAGPMTVFVAPAAGRVATVACLADDASAARSFLPRCERAAASLRLAEGGSAPATPSARQVTGLRRALRRLNAARSAYRSRLVRTRTPRQQAAAARMLARAHARTARSLRALALSGLAEPGARSAVRALERSTLAYGNAARAAASRRARGYARARRSALAADAALRRALRSLRVVGFAG
jgi:hypothetical protein